MRQVKINWNLQNELNDKEMGNYRRQLQWEKKSALQLKLFMECFGMY